MKKNKIIYLIFLVISLTLTNCSNHKKHKRLSTPIIDFKIVYDGNSLVIGSGSSGGLNYPKQLHNLQISDTLKSTYINYGIAGQKISDMSNDADQQIDQHVLTHNILIGWEVINQWGINQNETKEYIYNKYKQYFLDRIDAGWKNVVALTPLAMEHSEYMTRSSWKEDRLWFRNQINLEFPSLGITVIDVGADPRLSDCNDLTYFTSDKIHLNNIGYSIVADLVNEKIKKLKRTE